MVLHERVVESIMAGTVLVYTAIANGCWDCGIIVREEVT